MWSLESFKKNFRWLSSDGPRRPENPWKEMLEVFAIFRSLPVLSDEGTTAMYRVDSPVNPVVPSLSHTLAPSTSFINLKSHWLSWSPTFFCLYKISAPTSGGNFLVLADGFRDVAVSVSIQLSWSGTRKSFWSRTFSPVPQFALHLFLLEKLSFETVLYTKNFYQKSYRVIPSVLFARSPRQTLSAEAFCQQSFTKPSPSLS